MAETTKRNISLPTDLDARLADVKNVSGLIAELLTAELDRRDQFGAETGVHEFLSRTDDRRYRFEAREVGRDFNSDDTYFEKEDGTMIVVDADDHPTVITSDGIEEWFDGGIDANRDVSENILDAFNVKPVVWL